MLLHVLGSAAGGGLPQWNCGCRNCEDARRHPDSGPVRSRTQESVAVRADGGGWVLLNASPDIREQLARFGPLWPRAPRDVPMAAVVLTSAELDHTLGLLSLREGRGLVVLATERVRRTFTDGNVLYGALERQPEQTTWVRLQLGQERTIAGLGITAVPAGGKAPAYRDRSAARDPEDAIALVVRDPAAGRVLAYSPGVGTIDEALLGALAGADCIVFDGTFWSSDELAGAHAGARRAEELAHVPIVGPGGSLARLAALDRPRRIFIHMNNTNPIVREDSPERAAVEAAGWEVAFDGMEVRP